MAQEQQSFGREHRPCSVIYDSALYVPLPSLQGWPSESLPSTSIVAKQRA